MTLVLQPALRRLLGGETRARVLGLLADATVPRTGYELAKAARASPSKVYGSSATLRKRASCRSYRIDRASGATRSRIRISGASSCGMCESRRSKSGFRLRACAGGRRAWTAPAGTIRGPAVADETRTTSELPGVRTASGEGSRVAASRAVPSVGLIGGLPTGARRSTLSRLSQAKIPAVASQLPDCGPAQSLSIVA